MLPSNLIPASQISVIKFSLVKSEYIWFESIQSSSISIDFWLASGLGLCIIITLFSGLGLLCVLYFWQLCFKRWAWMFWAQSNRSIMKVKKACCCTRFTTQNREPLQVKPSLYAITFPNSCSFSRLSLIIVWHIWSRCIRYLSLLPSVLRTKECNERVLTNNLPLLTSISTVFQPSKSLVSQFHNPSQRMTPVTATVINCILAEITTNFWCRCWGWFWKIRLHRVVV